MPGLGSRLGFGGATTTQQSLADSDCIVIMGSNMAENHPVGFRFVMQTRDRGAKVIHIDPRFSRTSAMADLHVPIRPGTDLLFLGALINYTIENDLWFHEYVQHYTNAAAIISKDYRDTEDLGGIFSGYDPETRQYDQESWQYEGEDEQPEPAGEEGQTAEPQSELSGRIHHAPHEDHALQHPNTVFQILKRHFSRYTPEIVEESCGVPVELFLKVADAITSNSGRERTTSFCYSVAWTQHTNGSQTISACAILQLLLGNIGRPGGGILALRGHATIQGSTDIPTLYDLLPGYLAMPSPSDEHSTLAGYLEAETPETSGTHGTPAFLVSLLKAWYGENATPANDFCYDLIPKVDTDYSYQAMFTLMMDRTMRGLFCMGMNPAVGGQHSAFNRSALGKLDWLVVRDAVEIESASFWKDSPEVRRGDITPAEIGTEIFLLPSSVAAEKEGSFTNTQRLVQWKDKSSEGPGDCVSDVAFVLDLARRLKQLYVADDSPLGRQIRGIALDYGPYDEKGEPNVTSILKEINGYTLRDIKPVAGFDDLADDGSTACGCWIYSGIMPEEGLNLARRRDGDSKAALEWGFAWPANRRILYNRASADPDGRPWSERKAWVWWDEVRGEWTGHDVPDFPRHKRPDYVPDESAVGIDAHRGDAPFMMMGDGHGWLFAASGLHDGPLPTHYEPWESPVENIIYPDYSRSPTAISFDRSENPYHRVPDERFPYVLTTYRLTEHHTAGGMSRWIPWLAELQPEAFAEISPELAKIIGVNNGDWVTLWSLRSEIEARVLVTDRLQPLRIHGRDVHQIGMPYHYGFGGIATGASANDLLPMIEDPNSLIYEAKALTCNLRAGRLAHRNGGRP